MVDRGLGIGGRLMRFPIAVPVGLAIALVTESRRQGNEASDVDMEGMPSASPARSLTAAGGVVLVGSGLAYAERLLSDLVGVALADVLPGSERSWNLTTDLAVLGGFAAGVGALFQRVIHNLEAGTTAIDPIFTQFPVREIIGPSVSGSEASLVSWESLGREGRRHAVAAARPEPIPNRIPGVPDLSIQTVMREPARATPVEVYVGIDAASTMTERGDLALAEMDRTSAWDRSLITLVSPTGTGYVNYCAVAAVQYLSRGDVVTVTLQYSKRPSPLSLGKVGSAREQNRLLWLKVLERARATPAQPASAHCAVR